MGVRVRITEVGPRDGLQNEAGVIPTEAKAGLVLAAASCGVDEVEVTSFVHPKWVPQLSDAAEVVGLVARAKPAGVVFSALVPNEAGLRRLLETNAAAGGRVIDKASVFTAASETFSRRNTNATIAETLERFGPVVRGALAEGLEVRGYVSCAVACPYEGPIGPGRVAEVAGMLLDLGVGEIDLGDTIGVGTPETVGAVVSAVLGRMGGGAVGAGGEPRLTVHLHDTFGRAGACVGAAMALGVRSFDGALAGLGGCPFASTPGHRAPGNIATAALVRAVEGAGGRTGVEASALERATAEARRVAALGRGGGAS